MKTTMKSIIAGIAIAVVSSSTIAATEYKIGFSHYTGWEPWAYIHEFGIMDKWNKKYDTAVQIEFYNSYGDSLSDYTSGTIDGVTSTYMDALMGPASGGIRSIALINGSYSFGNDGVAARGDTSCANIKDREVLLVEGSVSHYVLATYLTTCGMTSDDVILLNTSDADIASVYLESQDAVVVTWNPPLQQVMSDPDTNIIFSSKDMVPGEVLDTMYVNANMDENSKKAITGAWFEAMNVLFTNSRERREMVRYMAKFSGATQNEFKAQMRTTAFLKTPQQAMDFVVTKSFASSMEKVNEFIFTNKLYTRNVKTIDYIGIKLPNSTLGNTDRTRITFDNSILQLANDGNL